MPARLRRRRLLLQSLAALAPLPQLGAAAPIFSEQAFTFPHDTLRALVDTLIPRDDTPAASELGVDQALTEIVRRREDYRRLVEEGAAWLDKAARTLGAKGFAAASDEQRIVVVRQAERAGTKTLPRLLFERVRSDALSLYYAQPAAWPSLNYAGPPQPAGFLDFEQPPPTRR
jgi:gluconate 2-dehydrogenase subunit 3-like protein